MPSGGLSRWFNEKWVDLSRPKKGGGYEPCGRADADKGGYPKCVPASRAAQMTQEEIQSAIRRKRLAENNQRRKDKKPIMVETVKKGDFVGHPFRGNQWTGRAGGRKVVVGPENVEMLVATPIAKLKARHGIDTDWQMVTAVSPDRRAQVAKAYTKMPETDFSDPEVKKAWDDAETEIKQQFNKLTKEDGIKVKFVDEDPYNDFHDMHEQVTKTGVLKVLKTEATGGHPYWANETNDMFRAVHDAYGHLGTGRGFDRHGEEAAYQAHRSMFGESAQRALATELRGQNQFLIENGFFGEQKVGFLPVELQKRHHPSLAPMSKSGNVITSDDDNAYKLGGSHHVTGGRHFTSVRNLRKGEGKNIPADMELYNRVKAEAKKKFDVYPSAYANGWLVQEYKRRGGKYKTISKDEPSSSDVHVETLMNNKSRRYKKKRMQIEADMKKGDLVGHPFRGNQHTSGRGGAGRKNTKSLVGNTSGGGSGKSADTKAMQHAKEIDASLRKEHGDKVADTWKPLVEHALKTWYNNGDMNEPIKIGGKSIQVGGREISSVNVMDTMADALGLQAITRRNITAEDFRTGSAVKKGDFMGHPFRGNQWTRGMGVSRMAGRAAPKDPTARASGGGSAKVAKPKVAPKKVKTEAEKDAEYDALNTPQAQRYNDAPDSLNHDGSMNYAVMPRSVRNRNLSDSEIVEYCSMSAQDCGLYSRAPAKMGHAEIMANIRAGKPVREVGSGWRRMEPKDVEVLKKEGIPVPPGWKEVHVSVSPNGKNGFRYKGIDAKGKEQPRYTKNGKQKSAKEKFKRVADLEDSVGKLDRALTRDLNAGKEEAKVAFLIRRTGMRPGGEGTRAAQAAFGASTLEARHVTVRGDRTIFKFTGKKGVAISLSVKDAQLAKMMTAQLAGKRGRTKLFNTNANKVNEYIKSSAGGDFSAKDLRTALATREATNIVRRMPKPKNPTQAKKARKEVGEKVSQMLGNKPTEALNSYINPAVFAPWGM